MSASRRGRNPQPPLGKRSLRRGRKMKSIRLQTEFPAPGSKTAWPLARTTIILPAVIVDIYKQRAGGIVQNRRPTLP